MRIVQKIKKLLRRKRKVEITPKFKDFDKSLNAQKDLRGRFCTKPFSFFEISSKGRVYACCPNWLFTPLGNTQKSSPKEIWNSEAAQVIRASILDGSFQFCNHKICPAIQNDSLPTVEEISKQPFFSDIIENKRVILETAPNFFNFSNDASCNLACPSCRIEKILVTEGPQYEF